jgi:ATP-dependent Lon protease
MNLPLLPLRDVVVFPHMVIPLFVGRPKSIKALEPRWKPARASCWSPRSRRPRMTRPEDLYPIGTLANILQMLKLPDGTVKVLVEGVQRARIRDGVEDLGACSSPMPKPDRRSRPAETREVEAMRRSLIAQFDQYVKLNKKIPPES